MSKVTRIVATKQFEAALKDLKKKHKTTVLTELANVIDDLANFRVSTQNQNHPLKNAEGHRDLHLEGKRLILLYRYEYGDSEDELIMFVTLRLQDLVNHKELSNYDTKKYKADAHEFDIEDIKSTDQIGRWFKTIL